MIQNQTHFTELATVTRIFSLFLFEVNGKTKQPYTVLRNGQGVRFSGGLTFFVNPQDLAKDQPARNHVTRTPHGHWVDSFGLDLPKWTLRGVTGWRARPWDEGEIGSRGLDSPDRLMDGYLAYHALHDLLQTYFDENQERTILAARTGTPQPLLRLYFRDHHDDDYWIVEPDGVPTKRRSKDQALWINYELRFTGLQDLRVKQPGVDDPIGDGLHGGEGRVQGISKALTAAVADTDAAATEAQQAATTDPVAEQQTNTIVQAAQADPLGPEAIQAISDYQVQVDLARDTGTSLPSPSAALAAIQSAASTVLSSAKTFGQRLDGARTTGKGLLSTVNQYMDRGISYITTPIKSVNNYVKEIRGLMLGLGWALSLTKMTARFGMALRNLRTSLRNLLCAVQSLLAFPYLFVKGMRDSLQAIFDLFRLSGCASTFPRVKAPTWSASLPLVIPRI